MIKLLLLVAAVQAQTPPRRAHHALAYDEALQRVILTGGSTPLDSGRRYEFFNDAWAYDGARWTALPPSGERLSGMRLAWDTRRNRMISFGGFDGSASRGDLRVLEHDAWQSLGVNQQAPSAEPGFAYDARRDRFVAFGGSGGRYQTNGDTWEWDGTAWTRFAGANPSPRVAPAMVYDPQHQRIVMIGGIGTAPPNQRPPLLDDIWTFDGTRWTQLTAAGLPARHSAGVAWDSRRNRIVVFGGAGTDGFLADTWAFDGTTWTRLADGPPARLMGYIAYDRNRDRIVLFGGRAGWPDADLGDTWEFDGVRWERKN